MNVTPAAPPQPAVQDEPGKAQLAAIVAGAAIGMAIGYAPAFNATAGVFAPAILREFHWTREQAVVSYAASMGGLAAASPFIGMLMDRFGVRRVILASAIVFSIAVACMSLQSGSIGEWIALSLVIGVSGAATSVLGYLAILPQWFDRRLGLATGCAMIGLGVGAAAAPTATQHLIAAVHWRATYQIIACVSLVGSLLACALIRERKTATRSARRHDRFINGAGSEPAFSAVKLCTIFAVAFLTSSATLSLNPHLPALLTDRGLSAGAAAHCASLIGVGILVGRLLSGILIDRFHAPFVGAGFFLAGAAGYLLLMNAASVQSALFACACIGLAIGAEGDLLSYLIRAYLGLRRFGLHYGIAFAGYAFGAVIGPLLAGRYFDLNGSYELPLRLAPLVLLVACVLLVSLGKYRALQSSPLDAQLASAET
ncbi:MFS transporter [Paraburkholderia silviterrae]|uniref:MFS transporter n=1 Tax=Paraburkholderia silviterrae TaxID=2528715 RepID=A0A4V6PJ30_9BURK|nr:MFS transporter [Paraburkholderia silviterrae]TDG21294.1 MFS transporter [Paraburkholderia silviterrae]